MGEGRDAPNNFTFQLIFKQKTIPIFALVFISVGPVLAWQFSDAF